MFDHRTTSLIQIAHLLWSKIWIQTWKMIWWFSNVPVHNRKPDNLLAQCSSLAQQSYLGSDRRPALWSTSCPRFSNRTQRAKTYRSSPWIIGGRPLQRWPTQSPRHIHYTSLPTSTKRYSWQLRSQFSTGRTIKASMILWLTIVRMQLIGLPLDLTLTLTP